MAPRRIIVKFFIPLIMFGIPFAVPLYNFTYSQNLLNVVSLLFVIILGFFIAAATSNYLNFQSCLAEENSALIILFNITKLVAPSSAKKVVDLIDDYVIKTLDYKIGDYADHTQKEYDEIVKEVDGLKINKKSLESSALFSYMHEVKGNLLKVRQDVFQAGRKVMYGTHWTILILLTFVIEFLLLSMRDGNVFTSIVMGVVTAALYLSLILLYEVDSNIFLEEQLAYADPQKVFEAIGKLPYYPETAIKYDIVKELGKKYRVGIYENYPESLKKTIKIVDKNRLSSQPPPGSIPRNHKTK